MAADLHSIECVPPIELRYLKGHTQLAHMRIRYHFKASLDVTET